MIAMQKMAKHFAGMFVLANLMCCTSSVEKAWKDALRANSIAAYNDFLNRYEMSNPEVYSYWNKAHYRLHALYFEKAKEMGTIAAYEDFLRRTNYVEFIEEAQQRLEPLYFEKAKEMGTIAAYEDFLRKNPSGYFVTEASRNLQVLKTEIRNLEEALKRVLPKGLDVKVSGSQYPKEPEFIITAHFLEGHSTDETSPLVRGDYGTKEEMTRGVQLRCTNIIKSTAKYIEGFKGAMLVVSFRHGVSVVSSENLGGTNVAMPIYEVSIPVAVLLNEDVKSMGMESFMKLWEVRRNMIPSLQFQRWILSK